MSVNTDTPSTHAMRYGTLLLITLYCLAPFFWLMVAAFDTDATLFLEIPETFSMANFGRVFFDEGGGQRWLFNSLIVCGGATLLTLLLAGFGGYALSRTRAWWKRPFLYGVILIRVIPPTALIVPL